MDGHQPIAESPWFWLTIFSAVGLLFLIVIGPKYGRRQSQLERQYQARGQVHRDVAEGRPLGELAQDEAVEYSTPQKTLITLTPLKIAIGIVFVVSAGMLIRRRVFCSKAYHSQ